MALSPFTPWGDESATPVPVEETVTGVSGSWSTLAVEEKSPVKEEPLPEFPQDHVPYTQVPSESEIKISDLEDFTPLEEVESETESKAALDEETEDETPKIPDVFTVIDEMGMPYRIGRAFELLYNVKSAACIIESVYRELEMYFKTAIEKFGGDYYSTAAECTQNPDLTLALWGVDYGVGCMMRSIINFCISGKIVNLKEALVMLYTVGIAV